MQKTFKSAAERLRASRSVSIFSHTRPDGDSIGSLLGLGIALRHNGKNVEMISADGVPANFRHLPFASDIKKKPDFDNDLQIVVDCSDAERVGEAIEFINRPDLNIDHHVTNDNFAKINLVVKTAVSTTEILLALLKETDFEIPKEAAASLLTGLITDSLGFMTPNMTPEAMKAAAEMMELGAPLTYLYRKALVEKSFSAMKFWGVGLNEMEREDSLIWTSLTMDQRKKIGYSGKDDADLINQLSVIKEGEVRLIFVEQSPHQVKVSWRSQPEYDVSKIARTFGGGGHKTASGAMVDGSLEEVRRSVLDATRTLFLNGDSKE